MAVTTAEAVAVIGVEKENVGSMPIDGSTVTNETVGRAAIVGNGANVAVGAKVGIGGAAVAGGDVGVLGMLRGAQAAKSAIPNKRNMNLQS